MSELTFRADPRRDRFGLKGPRAAEWLMAHGMVVPAAPNSWAGARDADDAAILVARLGTAEFFLEDCAGGDTLRRIEPPPVRHPPGVYPVLREDAAFVLRGRASPEVLAQVCNVNFPDLDLSSHPLVMTSMIGVSVLVVPQVAAGRPQYRIWCDPTFGRYLRQSLGTVVLECGGAVEHGGTIESGAA
jgi:sarcosine oxidase subunit gamma